MTQWPIEYEDVLAASQRIKPFVCQTPLRSYPSLDRSVGCHVLVKHENFQPTNAFKVRNAFSAMTLLSDEQRSRGVVAATRGNHGIGLAFAGQQLAVPVTICVPKGNSQTKNEAIEGLGAKIIEVGDDYDDSVQFATDYADRRGIRLVHSTNDRAVLAGAATITLEAVAQANALGRSFDAMCFAVGGGSQAVGALTVLHAQNLVVPVFGVQAENAPAIHDSFHADCTVAPVTAETIADGIATRNTYDLTFDSLKRGLADMVKVSEEEIADSVRLILRNTHSLVEPTAAVGLAGLRQLAERFREKTVLVVLTGANIDLDLLRRIIAREM